MSDDIVARLRAFTATKVEAADCIVRLRAELAAEREKVERLASSADEANVLVNKLFAERDELREVLREARPFIFDLLGRSTAEMRERIDHLLLNKGGEDEG